METQSRGESTSGQMGEIVRPLQGVRVLAVEQFVAGPYGSLMLADLGAEVVKVEAPGVGEGYRNVPPLVKNERGQQNYGILRSNRNKQSLTLDLKSVEGKELFRMLVGKADVLWENLRPGVLDRLGVGWESLRVQCPRLIYASLSGFGHRDLYQSPYSDRPALDVVIQAMSGAMMRAGRDGDPPAFLGFSLADQFAGVLGAFGVLAALRWRDVTGRGTHVDLSMYDAMVTLMSAGITEYALNGSLLPRGLIATSAPFGSYDAPDGPFVIAVLGEDLWRRFAPAIGKPEWLDDSRLANGRLRRQHDEEVLKPGIESWAAGRTRNEAVDYLNAAGVPAAPVQDMADIFQCPHVAARNMLIEVDDPVVGPIKLTGNPIKMSDVADADPAPPPQLGQNTEQVLSRWLGLDSSAVAELRERGVV